jgi:hypothetical protein
MSDDDDTPGPSHRGRREIHDEGGEESSFPRVEQPAARWRSWRSPLPVDEVRRRFGDAPRSGSSTAFALTETKSGFVVRWTGRRKGAMVAELTLAGWEAGTQIHLAVPEATGASDKELDELQGSLARLSE